VKNFGFRLYPHFIHLNIKMKNGDVPMLLDFIFKKKHGEISVNRRKSAAK